MGSRNSRRLRLSLVIAVIAAAALLWHRDNVRSLISGNPASPPSQEKSRPAVKVITQAVAMSSSGRVFEAVGTGRARLSIQIYPAVSEQVTKVLFHAQESVPQSQLLVELDDRAENLAVRLAEIRLKDSRSKLARYKQAVKEGGVPQSEVDTAQADFMAAQIALGQARLNLQYRQIRAPFAGVVGIPGVDPGDRVTPTTLITSLDDRKILYVDYEIPEALAGALLDKSNQAVTVTTPAWPGRTFSGSISAYASRIDPDTRTLKVRASIDNTEDLLRPGMSFTTRWNVTGQNYPAIPEAALQWEHGNAYVWVADNGIAKKVSIDIIRRSSGQILVKGGLSEGQQIVVQGAQRLREGTAVEILENHEGSHEAS